LSQSATWLPQPVVTAGFGYRTMAYLIDAFLLSFLGGAFPYLVIATYNGGPSGNTGQQARWHASRSTSSAYETTAKASP
jgi:uncharacterized RDD family membrane protein YckC